jgi:hypothetical protein
MGKAIASLGALFAALSLLAGSVMPAQADGHRAFNDYAVGPNPASEILDLGGGNSFSICGEPDQDVGLYGEPTDEDKAQGRFSAANQLDEAADRSYARGCEDGRDLAYVYVQNKPGDSSWLLRTTNYALPASEADCSTDEVLDGGACRAKEEKDCEPTEEWLNGKCVYWPSVIPIVDVCDEGFTRDEGGECAPDSANPIVDVCDEGFTLNENGYCAPVVAGEDQMVDAGEIVEGGKDGGTSGQEPVQQDPPPPPCWSGEAGNNCPVGGALRFAAPKYAMVGVPVTMYAYASWRPDENSPAQPTNGTAVIRVDGEDYSGVEFKDGIAEWRFIPETEGMKEFTASGVVFSGLSGASAYIDTVPARTYVLEYDPAAYATAFKNKAVEIGEKYVITDPNQARSYLEGRYEFRVADKSEDVCAVYETKKGTVKAKFNEAGKCKVIWTDTESGDTGKFTFIAEK